MKKILDLKVFAIGSGFLLVLSGIGSWLFGMSFWQALLIGFACVAALGFVAAFENGDQKRGR